MARKVEWTQAAWNDLEDTADFIARDSSYYAAAFVNEVMDASRSLSKFAERGRIVPEREDPGIREIFVRSYRLIYHVTPQNIYILGLIHGARDLLSLWESSPHIPRPSKKET